MCFLQIFDFQKENMNKAILVTIKKEYMDFTYEMLQALSFNGYH